MVKRIFLFSLMLGIAFSPLMTDCSQAVEKPLGPVVCAGSNGGFEIFWFYPGFHKSQLGNLHKPLLAPFFLGPNDDQNAIFTQFRFLPPVWINTMSTYISDSVIPDFPGDKYEPIRLSLKKENKSGEYTEIWFSKVSLDIGAKPGGEIVSSPVGHILDKSDAVWTVLEWTLGSPTTPLIGTVRWQEGDLAQFYCSMIDSNYNLEEISDEYMIGLELLRWTGGNHNSGTTFKVQFTSDTSSQETLTLESNLDGDSLHCKLQNIGSGYVRVVARQSGLEQSSDFIHLDSTRSPKLKMIPQYLECHYKEDLPNDFRFQLSNTSGNSMSMRLYYDSSVFRIDKDSIQLPRFKTIYVNVSFLPPTDDTSLDSQIMICCGGNSYPIVYHVAFRPDKKLEVTSESGDVLPASFEIGEPYPNPFNSSTRFEILNSIGGELEMEVYNLLGQNVYSKVEKTGGRKYLIWDGHDIEGYEVPSGIYFFRFKQNGMVLMRKAILLK